jgi:hypothetical protein
VWEGRRRPRRAAHRPRLLGGHGTPSCCGAWPAIACWSSAASRATTTPGAVAKGSAAPDLRLPRGRRAGSSICCDNSTVSRTDALRESARRRARAGRRSRRADPRDARGQELHPCPRAALPDARSAIRV